MIQFLKVKLFYRGVPMEEPLLIFHPAVAESLFDSFDEHTTWEYMAF